MRCPGGRGRSRWRCVARSAPRSNRACPRRPAAGWCGRSPPALTPARSAGSSATPGTAITLIHNAARGYPRAVNNLAINALTAAFARGSSIVDEKAARIAISETGADERHRAEHPVTQPTKAPPATSARGLSTRRSSATRMTASCARSTTENNRLRTVRRCTPYLSASALIDIWLRCASNRIAAYSSTLDPIPAPLRERTDEQRTTPKIRPNPGSTTQPGGVSPYDIPRMGPIPSATPAPRPAAGGARTEKNSGASSECYSHAHGSCGAAFASVGLGSRSGPFLLSSAHAMHGLAADAAQSGLAR